MSIETEIKEIARNNGADLVGICAVSVLPEHALAIEKILPNAKNLIVVIARHSLAAINSQNNHVGQFDTIHTYDECARAAHRVARWLENKGHAATAVPAFIPLDMAPPKHGMRGEISWRQAGYLAGLGSYGENGLLVTPELGSAIRICGTLTTAQLVADSPLSYDACDHCMSCIDNCPTGALSGKGKIDKKKCGDYIFRYGFRAFQAFMSDLWDRGESSKSAISGFPLRELWQNFMTGNYYYCFRCQARCHQKHSD